MIGPNKLQLIIKFLDQYLFDTRFVTHPSSRTPEKSVHFETNFLFEICTHFRRMLFFVNYSALRNNPGAVLS